MKHQAIYKKLGVSYKNYTKLRNKYQFFAYITDLLTLDYILNFDEHLTDRLFTDLQIILKQKGILRGLDLAMFGNLACFSPEYLEQIRSLAPAISRYQLHKWQYDDIGGSNVVL